MSSVTTRPRCSALLTSTPSARLSTDTGAGHWTSRLLKLSFAAIGLCLLSAQASADPYQTTLTSGQWEQKVFPVLNDSRTIRDFLADDLPAEEYGVSWVVYTFDAEANAYGDPGIDGIVPSGQAFWIIQISGRTVTLDVPADAEQGLGSLSSACPSPGGCQAVDLQTRNDRNSYHMVGAPFPTDTAAADLTIVASRWAGNCSLDSRGCDLSDSLAAGFVARTPVYYSPAKGAYIRVENAEALSPWQGFWLSTGRLSGSPGTQLLLPDSRACT